MMELLTATQAANKAQVNAGTVYRWCNQNKFAARKIGGVWAIDPDSFAAFLDGWEAEKERIMAESRQNWAQSSIDAPVAAQPEPRRATGAPAPRGWSWSDSVRRVANEQAAARRAAGRE